MSEFTPPSLSGKQNQANENTEKQKKLTKELNDLIDINLPAIKKLLQYYIFRNKNFLWLGQTKDLVYEGLSHLPEVALEWDETRAGSMKFVGFAASRCLLRLIDEYRRNDIFVKANYRKYRVVKKIREALKQANLPSSIDDIEKEIEKKGLKLSKTYHPGIYNLAKVEQSPFDMADHMFNERDPDMEIVDWIDLKRKLLKSSEEVFNQGKNHHVYKILLTQHVIPKAEGEEFKTLASIGDEVDLSESRLSQMIKSDKMKSFISSLYRRNYSTESD